MGVRAIQQWRPAWQDRGVAAVGTGEVLILLLPLYFYCFRTPLPPGLGHGRLTSTNSKCRGNIGDQVIVVAPTVSSTVLLLASLLASQPLSLARGQAGEVAVVGIDLGLWSVRMGSSPQGHGPALPPANMHWNFPLNLHLPFDLLDQGCHYLLSGFLTLFSVWAS